MSDSVIDPILSNVFAWKFKAIVISSGYWHGIVAVINFRKGELFKVSDEPCENVSFWHIQRGIIIEMFKILH